MPALSHMIFRGRQAGCLHQRLGRGAHVASAAVRPSLSAPRGRGCGAAPDRGHCPASTQPGTVGILILKKNFSFLHGIPGASICRLSPCTAWYWSWFMQLHHEHDWLALTHSLTHSFTDESWSIQGECARVPEHKSAPVHLHHHDWVLSLRVIRMQGCCMESALSAGVLQHFNDSTVCWRHPSGIPCMGHCAFTHA